MGTKKLQKEHYTVGWICALPTELASDVHGSYGLSIPWNRSMDQWIVQIAVDGPWNGTEGRSIPYVWNLVEQIVVV